jgi:hypothetical protein
MATLVPLTPGGSRVKAYLSGGPELAAALQKLVNGVSTEVIMQATIAGGDVIAKEWQGRAPVGQEPEDKHPGAYRDSIRAMPARPRSGPAGITGATVVITTATVPGLSKEEQPRNYAAKLEFGSSGRARARSGKGAKAAVARPSARPAFDASQDAAAAAVEAKLRELVAKVVP